MRGRKLGRLAQDCEGATLVEYGLIVAMVAAVVIGIVVIFGGQTANLYRAPLVALGVLP